MTHLSLIIVCCVLAWVLLGTVVLARRDARLIRETGEGLATILLFPLALYLQAAAHRRMVKARAQAATARGHLDAVRAVARALDGTEDEASLAESLREKIEDALTDADVAGDRRNPVLGARDSREYEAAFVAARDIVDAAFEEAEHQEGRGDIGFALPTAGDLRTALAQASTEVAARVEGSKRWLRRSADRDRVQR